MPQDIDLSSVDLNLLVLFEAVLRERHVGRAGQRLHLSPSAISHGLARLRLVLHDPLFLKHPKGVVPSERALELEGPITDILDRVRGVLARAQVFDAKLSSRRFTIGAPDAVLAALAPPLLAALAERAPGIDLTLRSTLPPAALAELDARQLDLTLQPLWEIPPRFSSVRLYDEAFAIAMRTGHPLSRRLSLAKYCAASHVLVSVSGDPIGNVDAELQKLGRVRRVAVVVPSFLFALALVAETDLLAAVPRRAAAHARRLGVVMVEPPLPLVSASIQLIATRSSMSDAGVVWLRQLVIECS